MTCAILNVCELHRGLVLEETLRFAVWHLPDDVFCGTLVYPFVRLSGVKQTRGIPSCGPQEYDSTRASSRVLYEAHKK